MPTVPEKVPDNILFNKAAIIERSLNRMREEYHQNPSLDNYTHIDAMVLNIERACQAAIDAAQHLVAKHHYGIPQTSADAFELLRKAGVLSSASTKAMIGMTGFRNIALNLDIMRAIAIKEYSSLISFCREIGVHIEVKTPE